MAKIDPFVMDESWYAKTGFMEEKDQYLEI